MGYTHTLERKRLLPLAPWRAAVADCRTLIGRLRADGLEMVEDYDRPDAAPALSDDEIRFNGPGEDGHETFLVSRRVPPAAGPESHRRRPGGMLAEWTKTDRKPYDLAVCGCLLVLARHLGPAVRVTSDGDDDEENWPRARELCQELFGYGWDALAETRPLRLTAAGLLPWDGPSRRQTDGLSTRRLLADGALVQAYRRRWPKPGLKYVGRPFGAQSPLTPDGYTWQPGGRVLVRSLGVGPGGWYADSTAEARAEATKLYLWEVLYRLPGAGEFLTGVLKDHPSLLPLAAWADWLGDRASDRKHLLAERFVRGLIPAPVGGRKRLQAA